MINFSRRFGQSCEELVLLGDVFDFWRSRSKDAIRDSRKFFLKLSYLNLEIKYVIGNQDHHLAVMHWESHLIEKLGSGESYLSTIKAYASSNPFRPMHRDDLSLLQDEAEQ